MAPGETLAIHVRFAPTSAGPKSAVLHFLFNLTASIEVPLRGFGIESADYVIPADPVARADFSGDGTVGFDDFLAFASAFGSNTGESKYDLRIDMDGNGTIGFTDFLIFASTFGKRVNPQGKIAYEYPAR